MTEYTSTHLTLAEQPADNQFKDAEHLAIVLISHDYAGKTPSMWNAAYNAFNWQQKASCHMMVGDINNTQIILQELKQNPLYIGGGCGVGFKDRVTEFLDEIHPLAQASGAVNLIEKTEQGLLKGHNTDGRGYVKGLQDLLVSKNQVLSNKTILVLGAGGTSKAICFALADTGLKQLIIINRTIEKAKNLADSINKFSDSNIAIFAGEEAISEHILASDVIINTSTKGATGRFEQYLPLASTSEDNFKDSKKALESLDSSKVIISDIILRNEDTPFIKLAKDMGFSTQDGIPMVVNQGVIAFEIIHGKNLNQDQKIQLPAIMKQAAGL
jgi:shikimate dehydrogenase